MQNVQAAILVARELGISDTVIKQALRTFKPLSHRLEFVGTYKGIEFYDDAISTTPESTIAALQTITNVDTIFLGGEDRGYDFKNLEKVLRKSKIRNIVLFPDTGKRILSSTKGFNSIYTKSMKEAVEFAFTHTKPGKSCLLSTASPSYSVWKNFEEKGDIFKKLVKELGSKK
jgi:UDP-N-acetylmuramoylalanine--D-glutamate ligase